MTDYEKEVLITDVMPPLATYELNKGGILDKYISAYDRSGKPRFFDENGNIYYDVINKTLLWNNTPQGHKYWNDIERIIMDNGGFKNGIGDIIKAYLR